MLYTYLPLPATVLQAAGLARPPLSVRPPPSAGTAPTSDPTIPAFPELFLIFLQPENTQCGTSSLLQTIRVNEVIILKLGLSLVQG